MTNGTEDRGEDLPQSDVDLDEGSDTARGVARPVRRLAWATGSIALLGAMATDAAAVAGRHLGLTVLGSIEIVQACVVIAATSAIVLATIDGAHARVRILLEQVSPAAAWRLERGGDLMSAAMFAVLAAGSGWLAWDLWGGHEITEVLGLPLRWLRLFFIAGTLLTAALFVAVPARRAR